MQLWSKDGKCPSLKIAQRTRHIKSETLKIVMATRRLNTEINSIPSNCQINFLNIINDDIYKQRWVIMPVSGDFQNYYIYVNVIIPKEYPFKAPDIVFEKEVYHPNIYKGKMCLKTITGWNPKYRIYDVLNEILNVILKPNKEDILDMESYNLYTTDHPTYLRFALSRLS